MRRRRWRGWWRRAFAGMVAASVAAVVFVSIASADAATNMHGPSISSVKVGEQLTSQDATAKFFGVRNGELGHPLRVVVTAPNSTGCQQPEGGTDR